MPIKYLHLFETVNEFNSAYTGEDYKEPWVSLTEENKKVNYNKNFAKEVLTFKIISGGTITWNDWDGKRIQYSKNKGPWTYTSGEESLTVITVQAGDVLQFKGDNTKYGDMYDGDPMGGSSFSSQDAMFDVEGNIMSLFDSTNFSNIKTLPVYEDSYDDGRYWGMFAYLFGTWSNDGCPGLVNAKDLLLPLTNFSVDLGSGNSAYAYGIYASMFDGCVNLKTTPKLPCLSLAENCYERMFAGCTSLTTAPALPATDLVGFCRRCYSGMFNGCTSLTQAPELPSTYIPDYGYYGMFQGCTSLERGPEMAYGLMFGGWGPVNAMYSGCTNLSYISCPSDDQPYCDSYAGWVTGVAPTGTFVKKAGVVWPTGTTGIPDGWDVIEV